MDTTLATIRSTLATRAPFMYKAAVDPNVSWSNRLLDNHTSICCTGLALAGATLFDDPTYGDQAITWIDRARSKMQSILAALPPDGASLEGVTYWDYGTMFSLCYWFMSETLLNEKGVSAHYTYGPFYRAYLTVPYNTWNYQNPSQMDYSDCARTVWDGPSPHVRRLSAVAQNPLGQWYADSMATKGVDRYLDAWLNFIWYDPTLPAQSPAGMATLRHFDDMDIVAARSDWSGNESIVLFKCGPPCGHSAIQRLTTDTGEAGHAHPDANHFVLFGNNEFLIRDDGYLSLKYSANQNTLLVNGQGQLGEGQEWFVLGPYLQTTAHARILNVNSGSNLNYFAGEASPAYSAAQGVKQFTRHLLYIKPNVLVVLDDIQLAQSAPMELRFHPEAAPVASSTGLYLSQGANGVLRTELLTPAAATALTGSDTVTDNEGVKSTRPSIRFQKTGTSWRNVTAFSWDAKNPPAVTVQPTDAGYAVSVGSRQITFQWNGAAPVEQTPVPVLRSAQPVLPAFGGNPAIGFSSNSYIEIYGSNLASKQATWSGSDFNGSNAPQALAGVQVKVNGIFAYVYFVSPTQVNVNLPQDSYSGSVELQVITNGVPSNIVTIDRAAASPAMLTTSAFLIQGRQYVVALLPSSTQGGPYVGPAGLIPGVAFQQVRPGDRIVLYVLGAGPTSPATQAGVIAASAAKITSSYSLTIGGKPATVEFFGVVAGAIGLYQLNAVVPQVPPGDQPIELTVAGVKNQQSLYLPSIGA